MDVRLLVPGASDVPAVSPLSRAGYRALLEGGVRVFEWNGTMLHAKTAVADTRWSRVGSTNLNLVSWMSNYELDVAIEDSGFRRAMAAQYERDLAQSTEIVLTQPQSRSAKRAALAGCGSGRGGRRHGAPMSGSAGRAAAGAVSVGSALGAALTNRRTLGPAEAGLLGFVRGVHDLRRGARRMVPAHPRVARRGDLRMARRVVGVESVDAVAQAAHSLRVRRSQASVHPRRRLPAKGPSLL